MMKHKVCISIAEKNGTKTELLKGRRLMLTVRLLKLLFGDFCEVFVLTPGETVSIVEIKELRKGGAGYDA